MIFHHKHQNGLSKSRTLVYGLTFLIEILALVNIVAVDKHPIFGSNNIYLNLLLVILPIIFVFLESHFLKNIKAEHTMSNYFKAFFIISTILALIFFIYLVAFLASILIFR
jgi:hypothetical protein